MLSFQIFKKSFKKHQLAPLSIISSREIVYEKCIIDKFCLAGLTHTKDGLNRYLVKVVLSSRSVFKYV